MARRRKAERRESGVDSLYESPVVGRLINAVMKCGKKSIASTIVYKAIDMVNDGKAATDPLEILTRALENVKPRIEVKSRRVGGATYRCRWKFPRSDNLLWRCAG